MPDCESPVDLSQPPDLTDSDSSTSDDSSLSENMTSLMSTLAAQTQTLGSADIKEMQSEIRAQLARLCGELDAVAASHAADREAVQSGAPRSRDAAQSGASVLLASQSGSQRSRSRSVGDRDDAHTPQHVEFDLDKRNKKSRSLEKRMSQEHERMVKSATVTRQPSQDGPIKVNHKEILRGQPS